MSERVRFIRRNGRIIPIREKSGSTPGVAAASAGAVIAADAARTERVYVNKKTGITIDRKKFQWHPFGQGLGSSLHMQKKGEDAAKIFYYKNKKEAGTWGISWLSTQRKFRGQGLSKVIAKEAARDMREQGGKRIVSHVVHPNSAKLGGSKTWNRFWIEKGDMMELTRKKVAMKHVEKWFAIPQKKGMLERIAGLFNKEKAAPRAIFRETALPKLARRQPVFRTFRNKMQLALGAALLVGGIGYLATRKREK